MFQVALFTRQRLSRCGEPDVALWQDCRSTRRTLSMDLHSLGWWSSFYTSLGHVDDFAQPQFAALLAAGIHWACQVELPSFDEIQLQTSKYASGSGRQRK